MNEPSISATAFESLSCVVLKENGWYFKEKKTLPRTTSAEGQCCRPFIRAIVHTDRMHTLSGQKNVLFGL